ncbi:MAG: hypothetical protein WCP31_05035 [Chloroflexales bacterium]
MPFPFLRRHTTSLLLGFVALGFAFLLVELFLMGHTEESQRIALAASAVGMLLSLGALIPQRTLRTGIAGLFVLLALSGVYGSMEHREDRSEREEEALAALETVEAKLAVPATNAASGAGEATVNAEASVPAAEADGEAVEVVGEALNSFANNPPLLSPLALSGLAGLGLLVLLTSASPAPLQVTARQSLGTPATGD